MERWGPTLLEEDEDREETTDLTIEDHEKGTDIIMWSELEGNPEPEPEPEILEEMDDIVWEAVKSLGENTSAPSSY